MFSSVLVLGDLRIHTVPKVASTAMSSCAAGQFRRAFPADDGAGYRFMVVRHPVERLASAWAYFTQASRKRVVRASNRFRNAGLEWQMPWDDFFAMAMATPNADRHIRPQADFAGPHEIDEIVGLDDLGAAWDDLVLRFPKQITGPIPVKNASGAHDVVTPAQRRQAERAYARDMEIFEMRRRQIFAAASAPKAQPVAPPQPPADAKADLRAAYLEKFGKPAHGRMKPETIKARLQDDTGDHRA